MQKCWEFYICDGFTVTTKLPQDIRNSKNKNETHTNITFTIDHD